MAQQQQQDHYQPHEQQQNEEELDATHIRPMTASGQRPMTASGQRPITASGQRPITTSGQRPMTASGQRPNSHQHEHVYASGRAQTAQRRITYAPDGKIYQGSVTKYPNEHLREPYDHGIDCICSACTCTHHRCPPTPVSSHFHPDALKSVHMSDFQGYYVKPNRISKNMVENTGSFKARPFQGESHYKQEYTKKQMYPRQVNDSTKNAGFSIPSIPFYGTTTNKADYTGFTAEPNFHHKPPNVGLSTRDNRDWNTEYRSKHDRKQIARRPSLAMQQAPFSSSPFDGQTTHQSDFLAYKASPSKPHFQYPQKISTEDNRDWITEQKRNYTAKQSMVCQASMVALKQKPYGISGHVHVHKPEGQRFYAHKMHGRKLGSDEIAEVVSVA